MNRTIKYCSSQEIHYFKLHLKYGFKTGKKNAHYKYGEML